MSAVALCEHCGGPIFDGDPAQNRTEGWVCLDCDRGATELDSLFDPYDEDAT